MVKVKMKENNGLQTYSTPIGHTFTFVSGCNIDIQDERDLAFFKNKADVFIIEGFSNLAVVKSDTPQVKDIVAGIKKAEKIELKPIEKPVAKTKIEEKKKKK